MSFFATWLMRTRRFWSLLTPREVLPLQVPIPDYFNLFRCLSLLRLEGGKTLEKSDVFDLGRSMRTLCAATNALPD